MGFCSNGSLEKKSFGNHIVRSDQHVGSKINNLKNMTTPLPIMVVRTPCVL